MCSVLDGGFSNELKKFCSFNVDKEPLWTAKALKDEQDAIISTHCNYIKAGADVIETSTFQASVQGFHREWNFGEQESVSLIANSVKLARIAIEKVKAETGLDRQPLVAGSIGSYGAFLCDGSEYTGKFMETIKDVELIDHHLPRIWGLVEGGSDLLLVETIPSYKEAIVVLDLIKKHYPNTTVWISFSIKTGNALFTPRDDLLETVFEKVTSYPQVTGFGINCCTPNDIQPFLEAIVPKKKDLLTKEGKDVRIIVYPNSGDDWVRGEGWIKKDIPTLDSYSKQWMDSGANVIGGCCQVSPDEISKIRIVVDEWNAVPKI